jgi:hypothetical protein
MLIYINGNEVGNISGNAGTETYVDDMIGDLGVGGVGDGRSFDGKIDEFAKFDYQLSSENVSDLYNLGVGCGYDFSGCLPTTPQIQVNISNGDYFKTTPINVSLNTTTNVNMSIYINGVLNQTFVNTNFTTALIGLSEGINNLSFKSEDVNGIEWNNISITLDTIAPNISIIGSIVQGSFNVNFSEIFNVTDLNLASATMNITYLENVTNASQYNDFINITDTKLFTAAGLYNGYIVAQDLAGNIATLSINGTVAPIVYIYFYDINDNPMSNYSVNIIHPNDYDLRIDDTSNPINVSPVFNDSLLLGNYTFIFDKIGYQLQNFTFEINVSSGDTSHNFTVGFSKINVNVFDRDTLVALSQLVNFELLNNGGNPFGAIFNTSTGNYTYINSNFTSGNYILRATSNDYNPVEYYFTYSGQENASINLYMLQANKTDDNDEPVVQEVKIIIQDVAGFNVGEGYIVKVLQQYASEDGDTFIVDSGKTNAQGEVLLNLEYNSIFYSIIIEYNGETLKRIDTFKITKYGTNCNLGECYYFSIGETTASGDIYASYDNLDFNLRYVNLTNSSGYIQFTFNDNDNLVGGFCLDTYQKVYFDWTLIDTSCLSASTGVISTIINGTDDSSFKAIGYIQDDNTNLGVIYVEDQDLALEWGVYGLVGTIILFFVVVGIGAYASSKNIQDAPAMTLALLVGVMWATDMLQMVRWGYTNLFSVTLIVGAIVWLLYRQK